MRLYSKRFVGDFRLMAAPDNAVNRWSLVALFALLFCGCSTPTLEERRAEKIAAYQNLSPETRQLVDSGQIKVGMPADAVYIAWGPPAEVLESEDEQGALTRWLYHGSYLQEYRYWNYREARDEKGSFLERYLDTDYQSRDFVRAEIVFQNGVVKSWRTLPRPL